MIKKEVTKFDAARRQLVTAIRLFFEGGDSISVYTLAHASWEVLDAFVQASQPDPFQGPDVRLDRPFREGGQ